MAVDHKRIVAIAILVAIPVTGIAVGRNAEPVPDGQIVARVIDGDTIEMDDGSTVRVAGIDTPERGQCGYREAMTSVTEFLGPSKRVTLEKAGSNTRDRYGRLVRYVKNDNGTDLGLWQIKMGVANARYDSRDGYAKHPHEAEYHRADAETVHMCEGVK